RHHYTIIVPPYAAPLDLHSSPTRRSSDLGDGEGGPGRDRVVSGGMKLLLQAQNLRSGYGEMEILHGVSMTLEEGEMVALIGPNGDRKSTRLNSSHVSISYAVFCLKKKKQG